ncbi:hypothetical protein PHET_04485 [Paragonimus heterotremus]|uniref:Uncharacterized protein n=1 Tax=Paragonimus heterotremus TaxID=100268 RepID=A0A8J4TC49_9TREM|nr:hypothetical protein PHET_04485 [Paragonimus heterotremus]
MVHLEELLSGIPVKAAYQSIQIGEVASQISKEELSCAMNPEKVIGGQLDVLGDKEIESSFADGCGKQSEPHSMLEISKDSEDETSAKQGCKQKWGASVRGHVMVSLQSAASEEDESEQMNLSPIVELDEELGNGGYDKLWSGIAVYPQSNVVQKDLTVVLSSGNLSSYQCAIVDHKDAYPEDSSASDDMFTNGTNKDRQSGNEDFTTIHEELRSFGDKRDDSTAVVPLVAELQAPDQIISSTLNFSTLNGVPSMPDLPRVRDTRPRRIPPRRKAFMTNEENKKQFAEFLGGCIKQVEKKKTEDYLFRGDTNRYEPDEEDEYDGTTNDPHMTLEDFLTADDKASMHSTESDLAKFAGVNLENGDDDQVIISTDRTGRRVTGISPACVPRTSRSTKTGSKEPHLNATIENTESMTLASSTEPVPDPTTTRLLSEKTYQSPNSSDAIQSMPPSVENGSQQSVDLSCPSFAQTKPPENTLSDRRVCEMLNELTRKILPDDGQRIEGAGEY